MPSVKATIPRLQDKLPLFRFFCAQLGAEPDFKPLRELLKNAQQGYADDGHSHFYHAIVSQSGLKVAVDKLSEYDLRIKRYVERLNQGRVPPVQLPYFQWLGVLFSEMFLDRFFQEPDVLRREINNWLGKSATTLATNFGDEHLTKVAYWMATGSGKTLIMHINLWQVQHYAQRAGRRFDNILLVTPNEGLSRQHLGELAKSSIPARHYGESASSLFAISEMPVTVIEITKLTENKRGGGLSVDVEAFGPNNLLSVDEGHRGASGEAWRALRERVAEQGFTFEYSATFGQIVNGASPDDKRKALLDEYSHAIVFDYSYPHFYEDGYGKDYWVVNVRDETDTFNESMMLANLLSFFEQTLTFEEHAERFRPYAIERPLWVFVGHTVTGGNGAKKGKLSEEDQVSLTDVQQIVAFFDSFLKRRAKWVDRIEKLLGGQSGLRNFQGDDIFNDRFAHLKQKAWKPERVYDRILRQVFDARPGETLRAARLKSVTGEVGLRAGPDRPYFGVINVGDVAGLAKLLEGGGVACEDDAVHASSLFDEINEAHSPVNVLIGARKFMEGWDSFRVASMGLMNIGRGEGSQIIQLFGRGVRLHGKGQSLKRSSSLEGAAAPTHLYLLETLTVFGVRANYMQRFREELQREGIETDFEVVDVPIRVERTFLGQGLQVLRLPEGADFARGETVVVRPEDQVNIALDLRPKLEVADSSRGETAERSSGEDRAGRLKELAALLDWERIYFDLLEYKQTAGLTNLVFTQNALRGVLQDGRYSVYCADHQLSPSRYGDLRRVEDVAGAVLRKYVARFYDHARRAWEQENLRLRDLADSDANLDFERYEVTAKRDFAKVVRKLVRKADDLYKKDLVQFPTIHFSRHLYQPLLAFDHQGRYKSVPPPLNQGETRLVRDLREFLQKNPEERAGKEIFLLRNLTRGRGIGFFTPKDGEAFYPDFILWVIGDGSQSITFIDPHGLGRARGLKDPKIQLHAELARLVEPLQAHCKKWRLHLTSFIVSPNPYESVRKGSWVYSVPRGELEREHVLFQEADGQYVATMWSKVGALKKISHE
jgi:Type III restriction enzyme, res subunit